MLRIIISQINIIYTILYIVDFPYMPISLHFSGISGDSGNLGMY